MAVPSIAIQLDATSPKSAVSLKRRSISIFSRRGTVRYDDDAAVEAMRGFTFVNGSNGSPRSKPKGTVLNAVPQTGASLAPSKISLPPKLSSPLDFACQTASDEATTLKKTQAELIAERRSAKHRKHAAQKERIGVWVDGIVHWEGVQDISSPRHIRAASDETSNRKRPNLTVVIPHVEDLGIVATRRPATRDGSSRRTPSLERRRGSCQGDLVPLKHVRMASPTPASPVRQDASRSSSFSSGTRDDTSIYSKHSSNTSVDAHMLKKLQSARDKMSASVDFSIINPTTAGHDDYTPLALAMVEKPLPPPPPPMRAPATATSPKRPQTAKSAKSPRPALAPKVKSMQSRGTIKHSKSMSKLDMFDLAFMNTSPYVRIADDSPDSPTLAEAEDALQEHLGLMSTRIDTLLQRSKELQLSGLGITVPSTSQEECCVKVQPKPLAILPQAPSRAPTLPRKSSRRQRQAHAHTATTHDVVVAALSIPSRRLSDSSKLLPPAIHDAPADDWWVKHRLSRSASSASLTRLHGYAEFIIRDQKELVVLPPAIDDGLIVVTGPTVLVNSMRGQHVARAASQRSAETVLVHILASLTSFSDLANTIRINKGMYKVYRENEQALVKQVALNESAPACELREWLKPAAKAHDSWCQDAEDADAEPSSVEQSPASYVLAWTRDLATIESLKRIIVAKCQSYMRKDTVAAMMDKQHPRAQQVTDAFWRIWTFCTVFGGNKDRDEDMGGQLDWLKGGRLANNLDCAATVNTNFDFDVGSILLNAPEHFGQGNGKGLTADQLYDVTEIWTCLATLLQGYLDRVDQAREYGVYDGCLAVAREECEHMLEEWIAYVLTLGPKVVLQLAEHASDPSPAGFILAQRNGWTTWSPPVLTASRVTFLKEPVARLYEERVVSANAKARDPKALKEKLAERERIQGHAKEIRMRRQDSAFKRLPLVDMSMERPMSVWSSMSTARALTPRFPPRDMTLPPLVPPAAVHPALRPGTVISPVTAAKLREDMKSPPLQPKSSRRGLPVASASQHSVHEQKREALRTFNGVEHGTVELAIQRIMSMGFSEREAKHALRTTDGGDGLRVDRAVEYLVRRRGQSM